jgi:NADPH-dependent ferric siderophore reductase
MKRFPLILLLLVGLMATTAAPALAHICENTSRSAKGTAKVAENSKAWVRVGDHIDHWLHEDFQYVDQARADDDPDSERATDDQIDEMVARAIAALDPALLDIVIHDRAMLASGLLRNVDLFDETTWRKQSTDGKGIDHRFDLIFAHMSLDFDGIYDAVMAGD